MSTDPAVAAPVISAVEIVTALNLGLAPAYALAQQYVMTTQALGLQSLALQAASQQAAITTGAVTTMACAEILAVDVASLAPKTP